VRLRPALTKLLVVLLLMQWGTAFAHCLRLAAPMDGFAVEICAADGVHRIVMMPLEEGEAPSDDGHAAPSCPACLGPAAAGLVPPPVTLRAPLVFVQAADPPAPPPAPRPAPTPSCQPRAPPTS
jgi:hypothetical protein